MLTAATLQGIWAFVPTPWDAANRLDESVLRHDVQYLCGTGLDGLYTTASSGEFYAMDDDEFARLVTAVLDEARPAGTAVQVCCGGTDTRSTLRRAELACQHGAAAVQIILPFYIKLSTDQALAFMADTARACGNTPLVHYNTAHAKRTFDVDDYRRLVDTVPTLIGTKLPRGEPLWFATICEHVPQLSHFTGEYTFAADMACGASGMYSWLAVTNPALACRWYAACRDGHWDQAMDIQQKVNRYKIHVKSRWSGKSDAAVNKADAAMNPNMHCTLPIRAPYDSCTAADLDAARTWAGRHFPELLSW